MTGNNRGIIIQDRDRHLLKELGVMRVIDREQTKVVAGFGSTTRANTRLLGLTRAGVLKRIFIGAIGSGQKALYTISGKGRAGGTADIPARPFRPRSRAAVIYLPRTSSLRYGKEKVNAASPTVRLACICRIVLLEGRLRWLPAASS